MNLLSDFLDKYRNLRINDSDVKDVLVSSLSKLNITQLPNPLFKRQGSIIYLNLSPLLKTEVLLHKQKILSQLEESQIKVTDIR